MGGGLTLGGKSSEKSETGAVGLRHYIMYFIAGTDRRGLFAKVATISAVTVAAQLARMLVDYWVLRWASDSPYDPATSDHTAGYWRFTTGIIIVVVVALLFLRLLAYIWVALQASRNLHDANFANVLRAPMVWFDVTPVGQVMNRFSKDMCVAIPLFSAILFLT